MMLGGRDAILDPMSIRGLMVFPLSKGVYLPRLKDGTGGFDLAGF